MDYTDDINKAMRSELYLYGTENYSEVLHIFEYSENMVYTKDLRVRFKLEVDMENSLYEVKLVLGTDVNMFESSCIVNGNQNIEMLVDISECAAASTIDFIKICVRSLDGNSQSCVLWVEKIDGVSNNYNSAQLQKLIYAEREKIKTAEEENDTLHIIARIAIALGVILVSGVFGIVLFIGIRKDDKSTDADREDRDGDEEG